MQGIDLIGYVKILKLNPLYMMLHLALHEEEWIFNKTILLSGFQPKPHFQQKY